LLAGVAAAVVFCIFLFCSRKNQPRPQTATAPVTARSAHTEPPPPTPSQTPANAAIQVKEAKAVKTIEVCGFGKVAIDDSSDAIVGAAIDARIAKDMLRWRTALLNSGDVRARAVGLFVDSKFDDNSVPTTASPQPLDSLVQLAQESHDPAVYAIALAACTGLKAPAPGGSCEQLSLQGWAKFDAGNAAPWLELAGAARAANDAAAESAAFTQAVKASKVEGYNWSMFGFAEADMPSDVTPFARYQLSVQMIGMEAAMYTPQMPASAASRHCSADAVRNESVRNQCSQLAELFVTKGSTVLDFIIGASIGARTGWPEARVAALKEEKEALEAAGMLAEPDRAKPESAFSCEAAARLNHFLHERAQLGEIAAAREADSLSGRTTAELAQSYREYLSKLMHIADQNQAK
jgi:hypothetical protein